MRKLLLAGALVAMLAALSTATAAPEITTAPSATPGVTSKSITIGGTFPLSGPASFYAPIPKGMKAYFSYINSRRDKNGKRGVYGRQIVWKFYDDGYNPANTVQQTNKLILQDKVFAVVGSLGTEHNQAIRPLLNSRKIPQLMVTTGASYWGTQIKDVPLDDRLAARLHLRGQGLRQVGRGEQARRQDRDLLPERRLREGLSQRLQAGARQQDEPDRLRAELRGDRRLLRVSDRAPEGVGCKRVGPPDHADANGAGDRDGKGARMEARADHHQLRSRHRRGHEGGRGQRRCRLRQRCGQHRVPEEPDESEVPQGRGGPAVQQAHDEVRPCRVPTVPTRSTTTGSRRAMTSSSCSTWRARTRRVRRS